MSIGFVFLRCISLDVVALLPDHVAPQHPSFAIEFFQLQLVEEPIIGGTGIHPDAGQQHRKFHVVDVAGLIQDVVAGKVVAASFKEVQHDLRRTVAAGDQQIGRIPVGQVVNFGGP